MSARPDTLEAFEFELSPFDPGSQKAALRISCAGGSYPIRIGALDWRECAQQDAPPESLALVLSNCTVAPLYAERLLAALRGIHPQVELLVLPDGEQHKTWPALQQVLDRLAELQADRRCVLYALGGGVIGDLCGFAAAIYMRGVRFIQVPTTLLAQVDSSVGGKTGINLAAGKNLVGAFHQPQAVWADLDCLRSLPGREHAAGLAEVIKYGPIADAAFFNWLEEAMPALLARDPGTLATAVRRSCEIKSAVVGADEREGGLRAILNFGHTFGHALEVGCGYGRLLHGEAVALGMLMATELSQKALGLDAGWLVRLRELLRRAGLPTQAPAMSDENWLQLMRGDKKAQGRRIRYVLLNGWGRACLTEVDDGQALAAIAAHSESV